MRISCLKMLLAATAMGVVTVVQVQQGRAAQESAVVINEIHCNPDVETELVEFVELYNSGTTSVNLSGWFFDRGITYVFPQGKTLASRGYLIVAENPTAIRTKWGSGTSAVPTSLIFGPYTGHLSSDGETVQLCNASGQVMDEVDYGLGFPWPIVGSAVPANVPGTGRSMQLINPALDNDLGGSWRSATPTPARINSAVYENNAPPLIRQVNHTPNEPKSNEVVTITAKVTDSDGILIVQLLYQIVEPGNYIPVTLPNHPSTTTPTLPNSDYAKGWIDVEMHDDGLNGDQMAGDDIYTAQLPGSVQKHRRLIRYTLAAVDNKGNGVEVPYADDAQPNFAYFVYDDVPAWKGAIQPGSSDPAKAKVVTYSAELMQSLPVYHLLSMAIDVQNCQYNASYDNFADPQYYFSGTLVYDGKVYDNVHYRRRGQYSPGQTGKEKWKFDFNRGHYFQARDDYGRKFKTKWDKMNVGTGTCPWWRYPHPGGSWDVGTRGMVMNEVLAFRLYGMAGVPCSTTNYFHFRIIDAAAEASATDQYEGDFWGLYITIEQADGAFLDEHDLPDGNVYRMDSGYNLTHQGATQPSNGSDLTSFTGTYNSRPSAAWWSQNVNLVNYYNSKSIGVAINDSDRRPESNCIYYHNSETNQWWMLPWDLDLTFEWGPHYNLWEYFQNALTYSEYSLAYENRARELLDLLFNGDQASQVVDEIAAIIATPYNGGSFVEANRAMWDYNPHTVKKGQFYENNEFLETKDWASLVQYYKTFLTTVGMPIAGTSYGVKALAAEAEDSAVPNTPTVTYTGPDGFPINDLNFQTTGFGSPSGSAFSAMKWRIAQVEVGSQYVPPQTPPQPTTGTLLTSQATGWRYFKGDTGEPSNPVDAWRKPSFNDAAWPQGQTSIGYGDNDDNTTLNDMQNHYTSIYLRNRFSVSNVADIEQLRLRLYVDDGCAIWINGTEIGRVGVPSGSLAYNATASQTVGNAAWDEVTLPAPYDYLVNGQNVIAIHALNVSLSSSDVSIDMALLADMAAAVAATAETTATGPAYPGKLGKYEVDPVWESEELTSFSNTVTVLASVVEPGSAYRVRCRMEDKAGRWSHWSDPVQFVAGESTSSLTRNSLRITELMYNPAPADLAKGEMNADAADFEFIELKNTGTARIDLSTVSFTEGVTFDFSGGSIRQLDPGKFVLVVRNAPAFLSRYGGALSGLMAGQYQGKLANEGEKVTLMDSVAGAIAEFEYGDGRGWPLPADGAGHSLVPLAGAVAAEPDGSLSYAGNWRASAYIHGSPGQDDPDLATTVVLNEVCAHTDFSDPAYPGYESNDWIELYNAGTSAVNLGQWYLSDDPEDLGKWALPTTSLAGHARISFDEITGFHNPLTSGFGLNKAGESLLLSYLPGTAAGRVVDCVRFKAQLQNTSLGRFPDGGPDWFTMSPSRDAANLTPNPHVVFSEIMYHPLDLGEEYVELYNPTAQVVTLADGDGSWRLDGAVSYTFGSGVVIVPGGTILVVGFDPAVEVSRLDAFIAAYSAGPLLVGRDIVGPWEGNLSNKTERIALERPEAPDQPGDSGSWAIVDEVIYADVAPWPAGADGQGDALHRIHAESSYSGNDPTNWQALAPSPGANP